MMPDEIDKTVSRRKFVSSLGLLGVAGMLPAPVSALNTPGPADEKHILKAGPYLQAARPDQITIRWITQMPCYSWVEYGLSASRLDQKAHLVQDGLVEAHNTVHAIALTGLIAGRYGAPFPTRPE